MDNPGRPKDSEALVIKADDAVAMGRFSNLTQVTNGPDSFVLDFAFVQGRTGWLLSRILMSPLHAKRFSLALAATLDKYEAQFGKIESGPTLQ